MNEEICCLDTMDNMSFLDLQQIPAIDVMQYGVVSIEKTAPVHSAVALLVEKGISGLPVTHEGELVGVLSEKDLLKLLYENDYLPGTVEDYMTPEVVSFRIEDSVANICYYLVKHNFRRVPIMHGNTIAGMITRADLIKFYQRQSRAVTGIPMPSKHEAAESIMQCGLLTVGTDTPLPEAMDMIVKHHVTGLPVVDREMNLLGMITEKDLLLHLCNPSAEGKVTGDIMTTDLVTFTPKDTINRICGCLIEYSFHRVPIVQQRRLVGIISRSDILRYRCSFFKK
jgi:CBS domain-containing protein